MKITYFILLTLIFSGFSTFSYAQEPTFSAELPEVREAFVGATSDRMVYAKIDVNPMNGVKSLEYIVVNAANPEEKKKTMKSKPEFAKGSQLSYERLFVHGDFVYEIHTLKGFSSDTKIAIVKRELSTLNQVGDHLELEGFEATFAKADDEGFYFFSKTLLYRIGLDLKVTWKKAYDMFSDYDVRLTSIEVDDNQNVLMSVAVDAKVKTKFFGSTPPRKSSLLFIITDLAGGDPKLISPEIPESLTVQAARFNYNDETHQLSGLFITAKEIGANPGFAKGLAYTFLKWDDEGSIVNHEKHEFVFNDFMDEDMKKNLAVMGVKPEKCDFDRWLRYGDFVHIRFLKNGNVLFVATSLGKYIGEMENSKVVFVLSPEGKLVWQKMLPYSSNALYLNADFFISENTIHFLIQEFTKAFESGSYAYSLINAPVNGKTVCLSERVLDLETGSELAVKAFANPSEKFIPTAVIYNKNDKAIVRYSFTGKNLERFLTIAY